LVYIFAGTKIAKVPALLI